MKRNIGLALVMVLCLAWAAGPSCAADATAAVDFNSAYVWRGMTFNDGMVAQPSLDVAKDGFGVNVWGNLDIDDYNDSLDSGEFSEIDLTLSYSLTLGSIDVGVGFIEYLFPTTDAGGAEGTRELYLGLEKALAAGFAVSLTTFYDIDEVEDFYAKFGLSYSHEINDKLSLGAGVSLAYAGDEFCADGDAGLYDYNIAVSLGYSVTEALSVTAVLNYTDALDDDNLPDIEDGGLQDVNVYGGVNISYTF